MKHLKSSLRDLHEIFDRSVSVRHLAEPFVSFDGPRPALEVKSFMESKKFDVVGVRRDGIVVGYVNRADLVGGALDDHFTVFDQAALMDESTPILDAMQQLRESPRLFVRLLGHVSGIVTKGDLQKAPVRMWLFGVISLLEMQFLRFIRVCYPDERWTSLISGDRLIIAQGLLNDRRTRNEDIDLADCLQFADKRTIVIKNERLRSSLGFQSKTSGENQLKQFEHLRDELAHAQDIVSSQWPGLVDLAAAAEQVLRNAEELDPKSRGN